MALFRELKSALSSPAGMLLGTVFLLMAFAFSLVNFIDWRGPVDDLSANERAHAEDCLMAARELGADAVKTRPDCRDVLGAPSPTAAAKTAP